MTRPNKPDDGNARLAAIEQRLRALEVGGRAEHTTMQGGLFRIRDVDGDLRAAMGDLDDDGQQWGFEVVQGGVMRLRDPDGTIRVVLGDVDATAAYGIELQQGGIIRVRDALNAIRAAMGDLDGDGTSYGFEVTRGGRMIVRDDTGTIRAAIGDLNDDGTVYGVRVLEDGRIEIVRGGALSVIDEAGDVKITVGDPDNNGDYWVTVNDGGQVVVNDGGQVVVNDGGLVTVNDGGEIRTVDGGRIRVVEGGAITVGDEAGDVRIIIGDPAADGNYQLSVIDSSDGRRFGVDQDGMHDPYLSLSCRNPASLHTVDDTEGAKVLWQSTAPLVSHLGFAARFGYSADPGVTGQIVVSTSGGDTDTIAVSGTDSLVAVNWLHPFALGTGPASFDFIAQVTSGVGQITMYEPYWVAMVDPDICTAGGV